MGEKGDKHIPYRNSKVSSSGNFILFLRGDGILTDLWGWVVAAYLFIAKFVEWKFEDIGEFAFYNIG